MDIAIFVLSLADSDKSRSFDVNLIVFVYTELVTILTKYILIHYLIDAKEDSDSESGEDYQSQDEGIEDEIGKQESLLSDLHGQISSGAASKKVEEQIWEQQRIVTQLKVTFL